jgi:hypothetical protein
MIVYEGPSLLNGDSIVGIVTGVDTKSSNPKTGPMAQLYILDASIHPMSALKTGQDESICGDCKHRPFNEGACYVQVGQAPNGIYKKYIKGGYEKVFPSEVNHTLRTRQRSIRLGAYGDPAAVPLSLLSALTAGIKFTGYTHQWKVCDPDYKLFCMASTDTPEETSLAQSQGWRTFRVRTPESALTPNEVICPASEEGGYRTTCSKCSLCMGTTLKAKHVAIIVHGAKSMKFIRRADAA